MYPDRFPRDQFICDSTTSTDWVSHKNVNMKLLLLFFFLFFIMANLIIIKLYSTQIIPRVTGAKLVCTQVGPKLRSSCQLTCILASVRSNRDSSRLVFRTCHNTVFTNRPAGCANPIAHYLHISYLSISGYFGENA